MANNRDLLKEAIADAKSVKETAIANAKLALEEAFTPYLQDQLSAKLQEMDDEDDKDVKESEEEVKEMDAPSFERKNSPAGDSLKDLAPRKVGQSTVQEDEVDEEIDLDELLAELELDENARTDAEEEGYKDGMKDEKADLKEDERTDAEEEGYLDGEKDEKEDMDDEDDEDIDLEDMSEEDLKKFIEDVIEDMVSAGEIEAGESFEDDVDVDVDADGEIEIEDDEETSVDVAEAKDDIDEYGKEEIDEAKDEMDEVKKDLDEAMKTVATLRSELNEINLLNAKLLYTNKVFRGKNLSENQKVKVLGAFDKAETVKEVKLVFETINSSVKSKTTNNSISEGFRAKGSASNMSAPKVTKKQPIVESDEMVARFKKLAGII